MTEVIVYMRPDASGTGNRHEHHDVRVVVHDHYVRIEYNRSRLVMNYPFTSIEKWEVRP